MSFQRISSRLRVGRPLVVDADTGASFRARGVGLDSPGALGVLLRQRPQEVLDHYRAEVRSQVDVLCALTADTTPRALAEVGMEHRSAMLTGLAVELALEAAAESTKPVAVAGVLGSEMVSPMASGRLGEELGEHAERLKAAGCELLLARGQGSRLELMASVAAAAGTELPTWAVVECLPNGEIVTGGALLPLLAPLQDAGASVLLLEVSSIETAFARLEELTAALAAQLHPTGLAPGVLLAAGVASVRGFPDEDSDPLRWVQGALDLEARGCRVIGGGAGTTESHTAALARALGALHPTMRAIAPDSG
ncbi:MAG TPA: homocysteine S-methyltransferase family protein [Polyangiaceae bacterium]